MESKHSISRTSACLAKHQLHGTLLKNVMNLKQLETYIFDIPTTDSWYSFSPCWWEKKYAKMFHWFFISF